MSTFTPTFVTTATAATYNVKLNYSVTDHTATTNYYIVTSTAGAVVNMFTGTVVVGNGTSPGEVKFLEGSGGGTNYFSLKAPSTLAGDNPYVWPNAYPGGSGYSLTSDTSGNLSWTNVSGGGGGISGLTTNTLPKATSSTTIGDSNVTDDGSNLTLGAVGYGLGFFGNTAAGKVTVSGVRTGTFAQLQTVVQNLLAALDGSLGYGLIKDSTT